MSTCAGSALPQDPLESAKLAGLRYVTATIAGIARRKAGGGWTYLHPDGRPVRDAAEVQRIKALVIPPAWGKVWICPLPNGHLQALGVDAKGRKQYVYHSRYREIRDATKYSRMHSFGAVLPKMRLRVEEDLQLKGLPRTKVLAAVVRLLERISVRVGNEEYARANDSYGITTLRNNHVDMEGRKLHFHFIGKSKKQHDIELTDRRLARILAQCQELPGQELFQFLNEAGEPCRLCSDDVNSYLREISGEDFTAKDFRTWNGSREAILALYEAGPASTATDAKKKVAEAVKTVAAVLRNRPAVCRKYYIHPAVLDAFEDGSLFPIFDKAAEDPSPHGLNRAETAFVNMLASYSPPVMVRKSRISNRAA
ncbi:MAG TPA: hypothetical protein VM120_08210 [Bryobacteraceae bacterium]|nr:hypothetical protein [Bryobacteraceae bacterium]